MTEPSTQEIPNMYEDFDRGVALAENPLQIRPCSGAFLGAILEDLYTIRLHYMTAYDVVDRDGVKALLRTIHAELRRLRSSPELFADRRLEFFTKVYVNMTKIEDAITLKQQIKKARKADEEAKAKQVIKYTRKPFVEGRKQWVQFLGKNAPGVDPMYMQVDPNHPNPFKSGEDEFYQILPHGALEIFASICFDVALVSRSLSKTYPELPDDTCTPDTSLSMLFDLDRPLLTGGLHVKSHRVNLNECAGFTLFTPIQPDPLTTFDWALGQQRGWKFRYHHEHYTTTYPCMGIQSHRIRDSLPLPASEAKEIEEANASSA